MKKIGVFVPKTIGSLFVLISLMLSLTVHARMGGGGGMDSGGGSGLSLIFRNEGFRAAKIIATLPKFPLSSTQFENIVRSTRVEVVDDQLTDAAGQKVAALTSPRTKLIRLNGAKIMGILYAPKISLPFIVHQYLLMAGIADEGNKVSKLILASNEKVLTNISCEAKDKTKNPIIVNYKESDSNGDQVGDAFSAFSYLIDSETADFLWQNDLPLVAKNKSGVMLTISYMGIAASKLFIPQKFLQQGTGEIALKSYYIYSQPERLIKDSEFICKHVTEDNYQQISNTQDDNTNSGIVKDDELEEIVRKSILEGITKSFKEQALYAAQAISRIPGFPLTTAQFSELVATTKLEFTDADLFEPGGMKVDALNYPKLKLIRINYPRAFVVMMSPRTSLQLIVHEFLGIAGVDDHDYSVSQRVLELTGETVTMWTCKTDGPIESGNISLSFVATDYNGDREADDTKIVASNALGQPLQSPLEVKDFSLDAMALAGSQVLWASQDSSKIYQVFLPQNAIEGSMNLKLPYFEVSSRSADQFINPAGIVSCQFGPR